MTASMSKQVNELFEHSRLETDSDGDLMALRQKVDALEQLNSELQFRENRLQSDLAQQRIKLAEAESRGNTFEALLNELKQADARYRELFSLAPVAAIAISEQGLIEHINLAGTSMLRYPSSNLIDTPFSNYIDPEHVDLFQAHLQKVTSSSLSVWCKLKLQRSDGSTCPVSLASTAIRSRNSGQLSYQMMVIDISDQLETEHRLVQARDFLDKLAHHDPLTDLPNRMSFTDDLHQAIAGSRDAGETLALLYFDLDGFKPINDTLGHQSGDQVLCEIARRLRSQSSEQVSVARLGGDEFTVIVRNPENQRFVMEYAESLSMLINEPVLIAQSKVQVSASIGVSMYPEHAVSAANLIKGADAAMYRAKRAGRGCVALCSREHTALANRQASIEANLRHAIEREQLALYFQPIYTTQTLTIRSVEALLRWHHPEFGLLLPGEFIALAEKSRLITELGRWIIDGACRQASLWQDENIHIPIAVNVSSSELLFADYEKTVSSTLKKYDLDPKYLEFEFSESSITRNHEQCRSTLQALHDAGHTISIDDFGSEQSCLTHLAQLPVSRLKIDRLFIDDLHNSEKARAIVKSMIILAHELGLEVVSEGIESAPQLEFLLEQGCDAVQGFMMSRAKLPSAITQLLQLDNDKRVSELCPDLPRLQLEQISP